MNKIKYCFLWLSTFLCLVATLSADFEPELPIEFYVKQRWYSWTTTFDIETKDYKLGYVQRRFFSLLLNYDFYDNNDILLANAKKRFWSAGAIFDVTDSFERP